MSTTFAPFVEATCVNATGEITNPSAPSNPSSQITAATTGVQIRPASSFLTPTRLSWITTPYYNVPLKKEQSTTLRLTPVDESGSEPQPAPEFAPAAATEAAPEAVPQFVPEAVAQFAPEAAAQFAPEEVTVPLEGFDVNKLAPQLLEVASESHISHVQTVISFFQKGGESAKTFGKIFLNDLALQRTVLAGLMNEPGNPLSHIEFLHKELALRLAASSQARQVAHLILADI